ncbi:NUDIX domain-containing protein [Paucisalibacillus globulus]|uniref:NUDIX domain-containing protein n=1 Tax=Paucisalibacillus globulus TaxID=351095 RepID=UPI000BB8EBA7|nr:NUDIX domain-containing protein [Paucisalibacillus globulus]
MKPTFGQPVKEHVYLLRKGVYAIALNSTNDRVLTVHNGRGIHFLPGGGVEGNESDESCIRRELLEETGYSVTVGSYIGTAKDYFTSSKGEYILSDGYFYLIELGEKVQNPTEEDHMMEWVHIDDMERLFFYKHQVWAVRKAIEK